MRVYGAYSNHVQFTTRSVSNYCESVVMRGGLAMIILTYISILLFIGIFVLIIFNTQKKRQAKIQEGIEMVATKTYNRL